MQVIKGPKCGPTYGGFGEQIGKTGVPGEA